jgi:hypothetical protein
MSIHLPAASFKVIVVFVLEIATTSRINNAMNAINPEVA